MQDRTRRTEVGKMLLDVAKYAFTVVVIGGLIAEQLSWRTIAVGALLTLGIAASGFLVIPLDEEGIS